MHLAKSGRLIIKLISDKVRGGEVLTDEKGRKVGKVMEVFGPVSSPYASLMLSINNSNQLLGSKVYSTGMDSNPNKRQFKRTKSNKRNR
jgi:rRNA processing protein Gar1